MYFSTIALTAVTAATGAMAAPAPQVAGTPNPDIAIFSIKTVAAGNEVDGTAWSAMNNVLFTKMTWQDAACDGGVQPGHATFKLDKTAGTLSLYSTAFPTQEFYVDRSGMGQGELAYTTGAQGTPRNAERAGWAVDADGNLTFAGSDAFLACPGHALGSYRVLPNVGIDNPAGYANCVRVQAHVETEAAPVGCLYSAN